MASNWANVAPCCGSVNARSSTCARSLRRCRGPGRPGGPRSFGQDLASVDDQRLTRNIASLASGQITDRPSDVLWLAEHAERDVLQHPRLVLGRRLRSEPLGADVPGHDRVDRDAVADDLEGGG